MKGAIASFVAAGSLCACATPPAPPASAGPDYAKWSCRRITAEIALTERAAITAWKRERGRDDEHLSAAQAFLLPTSLGVARPVAGAALARRLADLRRVSRVKRCASVLTPDTATA